MRVLVVEDDVKMAGLLRRGLGEEGLSADIARTGDDALWMAAATEYDAIVLDVMLPGLDGFVVCRRLREAGTWTPTTGSRASTRARTTTSRSRSRSPSCSPGCGRSSGGLPSSDPRSSR